ncbi:MAG: hypothetical protein ACFFG0_44020 [Candidatus Thorarchaeota archaeon]
MKYMKTTILIILVLLSFLLVSCVDYTTQTLPVKECPQIDSLSEYKINYSCLTTFEKARGYNQNHWLPTSDAELMLIASWCIEYGIPDSDCDEEYGIRFDKYSQWQLDNIQREKINERVIEENNPELCNILQGTSRKLTCIIKWLKEKTNITIERCELLPKKEFLQEDNKPIKFYTSCILDFIKSTEDWDVCVAKTGDITFCSKKVAIESNSPQYCNKITDLQEKEVCIKATNYNWNVSYHIEHCNYLINNFGNDYLSTEAGRLGTCADVLGKSK